MKIKIIAFGKFKSSQEYRQIFDYYKKRINFDIKLIELKSLLKPKKLEKEKDEIKKYINNNEYTFAMDSRGEKIDSESFSKLLFQTFSGGFKVINFVIGSEEGLDAEIRKSFKSISFGNFTWPHLLVRVMLIEQIYRALEIKKKSNYHK
jgi:23S rRNA (pseudouridine1915-N3)-methyltransferase